MNVFSYLLSYLAMQGGAFNVSAACAQLASVGGQILFFILFDFFTLMGTVPISRRLAVVCICLICFGKKILPGCWAVRFFSLVVLFVRTTISFYFVRNNLLFFSTFTT